MAESSLNLGYLDLAASLGHFFGYGRGPAFGDPPWSSLQQADIDESIKSGQRQFLFPPPLPGQETSYDWSFLHPALSMTFPSGASTVVLPDDFGGFEGRLTVLASGSGSQPWPVQWMNEGQIRQNYSVTPTMTGPPLYASPRPVKGTSGTQSQRFQLLIFPLADKDYTLQCQYYVLPDAIDPAFPYAYGGMAHAETLLQSCLDIAEGRIDDATAGHRVKFLERLAASVGADRKHKPQMMGSFRDHSDGGRSFRRLDVHGWAPAALYNGGSFD